MGHCRLTRTEDWHEGIRTLLAKQTRGSSRPCQRYRSRLVVRTWLAFLLPACLVQRIGSDTYESMSGYLRPDSDQRPGDGCDAVVMTTGRGASLPPRVSSRSQWNSETGPKRKWTGFLTSSGHGPSATCNSTTGSACARHPRRCRRRRPKSMRNNG